MHGLKEVLCSIERFQARYRVACQASKVASCGGMTGCAVLFPIAEADGYRYSSLLLSVFVWSIFVFHTLHLECYVKYGPHTVFLAFLLLLLLVWIPGGTTLTEFIPWLPLYAVLVSLATVALSTFLRRRNEPQTDLDSSWSAGRGREDPEGLSLNFMQGPRSQYSGQSSSDGTGVSLSQVQGQTRQTWDFLTRTFFRGRTTSPLTFSPRITSPLDTGAFSPPTHGRRSEDDECRSDVALLGLD